MEINNLASALHKAQSEMDAAHEGGYNPHFKSNFCRLTDLINASRPSLTKYGLSVTQYPDSDADATYLVTVLMHSSGDKITSRVKMVLDKPSDIQSFGKVMTYLKRYAYAAIVGIAIADEQEDDDGNSVSVRTETSQPESKVDQNVTPSSSDYISAKQLAMLKSKLHMQDKAEEIILRTYPSLDKIPWKKYNHILYWLDPSMKPKT